jgi:thioesterase domain-containing protein
MNEHADALLRELQATLDHEIPLSRAIGITALRYDAAGLALWAPLAPNTNHKSTAFAGSLNALTTLAGWGLVWLLLREHDLRGTIVIQESTTAYRLPVRGDFTAACALPKAEVIAAFVAAFRRKGKARLALSVEIAADAHAAVTFTGRYVALSNT